MDGSINKKNLMHGIKQEKPNSCGAACIVSVAKDLNQPCKEQSEIYEMTGDLAMPGLDKNSLYSSPEGMLKGIRGINLDAEIFFNEEIYNAIEDNAKKIFKDSDVLIDATIKGMKELYQSHIPISSKVTNSIESVKLSDENHRDTCCVVYGSQKSW